MGVKHLSAIALRLAGAILLAVAAPVAAFEPVRAPADSNAAADSSGAPEAAAKADDGDKTVCRRVPHTGTMIGWKRICKPKSEWRAGEG
jgi:hypothetical protein